MRMPKQSKRPQKPKSPEAMRLTQSRRGGTMDRVPSGKVYKKWDGKYDA